MMETKFLEIKNDIMWNGNCDRKCTDNFKMDSLYGKSPYSTDNLNDVMFNLCNRDDPIDLLDMLDSDEFNVSDLLLNGCSTVNNNNSAITTPMNNSIEPQTNQIPTTYYHCNQSSNYSSNSHLTSNPIKIPSNNLMNHNFNNSISNNNHSSSPLNSSLSNSLTNSIVKFEQQPSSLYGSSAEKTSAVYLRDDLLLTDSSANIILTQHNQTVDNSQLSLGHLNSNHQINYTNDNQLDNLDISNSTQCTDLVNCSNDLAVTNVASIVGTNVNQLEHQLNTHNSNQTNQCNNQNNSNNNYETILNQQNVMSTSCYPFDNHLIDSHHTSFCSAVNDSVCSSNNSECSSSVYTDDIEDDLDLLEDIIEEEYDHHNLFLSQEQRSTCDSIANSFESSSSDEMMIASPISDSLVNDHSYGANSIFQQETSSKVITPLSTNNLTNSRLPTTNYHSVNKKNSTITITNHHNSSSNKTIIHRFSETHIGKNAKRRSLANLQSNHQTNSTNRSKNSSSKNHSGTSLLIKGKQSNKLKKVMDTDRRKEHNESERQRRGVLKTAFSTLAGKCPKLMNASKRPSRIQTLNEATVFIRQLNDKVKTLENQKQQELQRKLELLNKLKSLGGGI